MRKCFWFQVSGFCHSFTGVYKLIVTLCNFETYICLHDLILETNRQIKTILKDKLIYCFFTLFLFYFIFLLN